MTKDKGGPAMLSSLVLRLSSRTYLACPGYAAVGLTNTVFGAMPTPVAGECGVPLPAAGLLIALQYGGFVIAGPLAGALADRIGSG